MLRGVVERKTTSYALAASWSRLSKRLNFSSHRHPFRSNQRQSVDFKFCPLIVIERIRPLIRNMSTGYLDRLRDAHVLVIGGSSGIGFSVASASVAQGARVSLASSSKSKVDGAVRRLQEAHPGHISHISGYTCDLADPTKLEANLRALLDAVTDGSSSSSSSAKLDHIVFTAGDKIRIEPLQELSTEKILAMGTVRFLGPLLLGKLAPAYMNSGPTSSITLTGGSMSWRPAKSWTVPAAWGSGVEGITRGLAVDLAPIRINMVSPGAVLTELFQSIPPEELPAVLDRYKNQSLLDKVGTPEDVAESYIYCMRSPFMTGTIVNNDGGRMLK